MKKQFFLFLILIFSFLFSFGQRFPNKQFSGSPVTLDSMAGAARVNIGFINRGYTDTTQANLNLYLKNYPFAQIATSGDNNFWIRSSDAKRWVLVGGASSSITNILDSSITIIYLINGDSCVVVGIDTLCRNYVICATDVLTDSTIRVCPCADSTNPEPVCDTLAITPGQNFLLGQNWVTIKSPGIWEFGQNTLGKNIPASTGTFTMDMGGYPYGKYPTNYYQFQSPGNSPGIMSWRNTDPGHGSQGVRLGAVYMDSATQYSVAFPGMLGNAKAFGFIGNLTGYGTVIPADQVIKYNVSNINSKVSGIAIHTMDNTNTEAVTIFGMPSDSIISGTIARLYNHKIAVFKNTGQLTLPKYTSTGSFLITDTALNKPVVADANGNLYRSTYWYGGGTTYTASNGLTLSTADFQLGSTSAPGSALTVNRFIDAGSNYLKLTGTAFPLYVVSSGSYGAFIDATGASSIGVAIQSTFQGMSVASVDAAAAAMNAAYATTNDVTQVLQLGRTTGTPANGIGASLDFLIETSTTTGISNRLMSKWTDVTDSTRTSQFIITGVNSANTRNLLTLDGNGLATLGLAGTQGGSLAFTGTTSGTITIQPQTTAGAYNFNLPITAGTATYVLTSQGGGATAMTWTDPATLGTTYTASEGLILSGSDFQLGATSAPGSAFTANRYIDAGANTLFFSGTATSIIDLVNTNSGAGIYSTGNSGGQGLWAESDFGNPIISMITDGDNNGAGDQSIQIQKFTTGTVLPGIGSQIAYYIELPNGSAAYANGLKSTLSDTTRTAHTSQFIITGVNSAVTGDIATFNGNKSIKFNGYGAGTFTGTATKWLAVDADGDITEEVPPVGVGSLTADNGLTKNTATNVQLGGMLINAATTVDAGTNLFVGTSTFTDGGSNAAFTFNNTLATGSLTVGLKGTTASSNASSVGVLGNSSGIGIGVYGNSASTGTGVYGLSSSGIGTTGQSITGYGVQARTNTGISLLALNFATAASGLREMIRIHRQTSDAATNGVGGSIDFHNETSDGNAYLATRLSSILTDVTTATRSSQFTIAVVGEQGSGPATTANIATFDGTGVVGIGTSSGFIGTRLAIVDNTVGDSAIVNISSTSTLAASNLQKGLNISLSGDNGTASQTTYGSYISNTHGGTSPTNIGIEALASGGTANYAVRGIAGSGTLSYGVYGLSTATNGSGVVGQGNGVGAGVVGLSTVNTSPALSGELTTANTNSVELVMKLIRQTSGTAAAGIGGNLSLYNEADDGSSGLNRLSNELIWKWSDATDATRTSQFIITGVGEQGAGPATTADIAAFHGTGVVGIGTSSGFIGTRLAIVDNTVGDSAIVDISSTSTLAAGNLQMGLNIALSGVNSNSGQNTYGIGIANAHTGTNAVNYGISSASSGNGNLQNIGADFSATGSSTTNVGGQFSATGASTNIALLIAASSGVASFGTQTPSATRLEVVDNAVGAASIVNISSTSTAAASNLQKGINVFLSGDNATASQITYGLYVSNEHGGTTPINHGVYSTLTNGGTASAAFKAAVTTQLGLDVVGTSGTGVQSVVTTGRAIEANATGSTAPIRSAIGNATTAGNIPTLDLLAYSSGAAANEFSGSIDMYLEASDNSNPNGMRIVGRVTDVTIGTFTTASDIYVQSSNSLTKRLTIEGDGRIYGTGLHNAAGAVTGTTNQYIASGTFTPTLTGVANVGASTAYLCQWIRVGNVVTVSGKIDIDATTTLTLTQLGISLPIASDFANARDCGGTGNAAAVAGSAGAILADLTNNRAEINFIPTSVTNDSFYFTFTYLIL